jgi:FAD/FMN-containing dehydrogenase
MRTDDPRRTAAQCRHYAMCKIDYLGTGICPAGEEKRYVSYYPQGRMDLYDALTKGIIPVTPRLIDIADSCTLCGVCDKQCHFVTGMRPMVVMGALKDHVSDHLGRGGGVESRKPDHILDSLRAIVGEEWAENDPAILLAYSNDPFPLAGMQMPRYVVMPRTRDEIVAVVRLAKKEELPFAIRGNGASVFGFVFSDGIVFDLTRMKGIEIDPDNWVAAVEPGVTSFELQREAGKLGLRVIAAEPAATVCGNIICTGTFSTWANAYGVAADNFVSLEFVDRDGRVFDLNDKAAPNAYAFTPAAIPSPGVCTKAMIRMHPRTGDEEGLLVPFPSFTEAVDFARELSVRRIGLAVGILGKHYISTFLAPSVELAERVKSSLTDALGMEYMVSVVGDRYARESIRRMTRTVIDQRLFRTLALGLPRLAGEEWMDLVKGMQGDAYPYEILFSEDMYPVLETVLSPSPETLAECVDEDLRDFYRELYERPEMTDLVHLTEFRILSCRLARHKHVFVFLAYTPLDAAVIEGMVAKLDDIGRRYDISRDYGFVTPIDLGKRAIFEYDYYIDHTDPREGEKIGKAMMEILPWIEDMSAKTKGVTTFRYVFSQGCSRKENYFYR